MRGSLKSGSNTDSALRDKPSSLMSTPRRTPNASHGGLPRPDVAARKSIPEVSHSLAGLPHSSSTPAVMAMAAAVEVPSARQRTKKKEKNMRPQNALYMLAKSMGNGSGACVTGTPHVVDLRALDPCPCPSQDSGLLGSAQQRNRRSCRVEEVPATKILDFLYLGSVKDAQDVAFLRAHQIRYIINVSQEEYWSVDKRVQIFTFNIDDNAAADIAALFQPTRHLIDTIRVRYYRGVRGECALKPAVLVHCQKGRSRSVTIVLAYLLYTNGWSVAEAMRYVGSRRPCAEPNIGFMEELRKLQESLAMEERTRRFCELCWFMRNLSGTTAGKEVRDLFETRIGMVRQVVMHAATAASCASKEAGGGDAPSSRGHDGESRVPCLTPTSPAHPMLELSGPSTAVAPALDLSKPAVVEAGEGSSAASSSPTTQVSGLQRGGEVGSAAAAPPAAAEHSMLCFVFFTCREDVLHGIKSGTFKELLSLLHPAPGKQIKYATGPKLKRIMAEHQSMSSSFVENMSGFQGCAAPTDSAATAAAKQGEAV